MALVYLALGVPVGSIAAILLTIQLMKFFLRTDWGESSRSIGGNILLTLGLNAYGAITLTTDVYVGNSTWG